MRKVAPVEVARFAVGQFAAALALGDARVLVAFAAVDLVDARVAGIDRAVGGDLGVARGGETGEQQRAESESEEFLHGVWFVCEAAF